MTTRPQTMEIDPRPQPPSDLLRDPASTIGEPTCLAAPDLTDWTTGIFLSEGAPLYTDDHKHLIHAEIGYLWTNTLNVRQQRRIVGMAEQPVQQISRQGKWVRARAEDQLRGWFGGIPDFLITIDALYAAEVDDITFAALIDHELYHCAQALDEDGQPRFSKTTGLPIYAMRGHDVEEFIGVVRRFGVGAAGSGVAELVEAARLEPEVSHLWAGTACGTCLRAA